MGADPMISGEIPTVAVETILPSGFRLRWRARFDDISSTAAAPSFRPGVKNKIQCFPAHGYKAIPVIWPIFN